VRTEIVKLPPVVQHRDPIRHMTHSTVSLLGCKRFGQPLEVGAQVRTSGLGHRAVHGIRVVATFHSADRPIGGRSASACGRVAVACQPVNLSTRRRRYSDIGVMVACPERSPSFPVSGGGGGDGPRLTDAMDEDVVGDYHGGEGVGLVLSGLPGTRPAPRLSKGLGPLALCPLAIGDPVRTPGVEVFLVSVTVDLSALRGGSPLFWPRQPGRGISLSGWLFRRRRR
jgi:hypothetical protein